MASAAHYVFDSNTIVSAFLFEQSSPGLALKEALARGQVLLSIDVAEELADVLRREKFDRYVGRKIREEFLRALIRDSVYVEISETIQACRDSKDDKFLELAVSGGASHIVTGDDDLLALHPFRGISIVTPRQFLDLLAIQ